MAKGLAASRTVARTITWLENHLSSRHLKHQIHTPVSPAEERLALPVILPKSLHRFGKRTFGSGSYVLSQQPDVFPKRRLTRCLTASMEFFSHGGVLS